MFLNFKELMRNYKRIQEAIKVKTIQGRYLTNDHIFPFLDELSDLFLVETIGRSVLGKAIKSVTFGSGPTKIFMWSQMHGNESTTTKAVLDFINFIQASSDLATTLLQQCTFKVIPILNPDGAQVYTRVNANQVDLNRDAQTRTQPESIIIFMTNVPFLMLGPPENQRQCPFLLPHMMSFEVYQHQEPLVCSL